MTRSPSAATLTHMRSWRPYPVSKDSGVAWLGCIPAHWDVWKIAHAFIQIGSGTTPPSGSDDYYDGEIPWVNTAELRDSIVTDTSKRITARALCDFPTLRQYPAGTLLVALYGATIGRVGILGLSATTNQACCALSQPKHLDSKFTFHWLVAHRQILIALGSGGGQPNISQETIRALKIAAPGIEEQRVIATFLDRETAKIDALITKREQLIALLEEERAALISRAVTKGLDPDVPLRDSGIDWLGRIPKHWGVYRVKHVAKLRSGHTPSRQHPEYWVNCTIPWFSLADVWQIRDESREYLGETQETISALGLANSAAELLPTGTVILSRTASVGFSGIMPCPMATTQDFANWVCGPKIGPEYLLYVFRSMRQEFKKLTMGSTHQTIYMPDVGKLCTPVPAREEQHSIVEFIRVHTARLSVLRKLVGEHIDKLKEFRTALISAAVTGKIDVRGEMQ